MNSKPQPSGFLNDGGLDAPKLEVYLNLDTLLDLPPDSACYALEGEARMARLAKDGFQGVQVDNNPLKAANKSAEWKKLEVEDLDLLPTGPDLSDLLVLVRLVPDLRIVVATVLHDFDSHNFSLLNYLIPSSERAPPVL